MTEVCSTDRWTCPRCNGLWVRDNQSHQQWLTNLRSVQAAHGRRCSRQESVR